MIEVFVILRNKLEFCHIFSFNLYLCCCDKALGKCNLGKRRFTFNLQVIAHHWGSQRRDYRQEFKAEITDEYCLLTDFKPHIHLPFLQSPGSAAHSWYYPQHTSLPHINQQSKKCSTHMITNWGNPSAVVSSSYVCPVKNKTNPETHHICMCVGGGCVLETWLHIVSQVGLIQ